MNFAASIPALAAVLLLAGCVSLPSGPGVMVLPGSGKNFDQFRADDLDCRQFASSQISGSSPNDAAASSVVTSAAVGTVIGAAAGAAFGGHNGAAAGAGTGLLVGSLSGASAGGYSQYELQRRYDFGYQQCMYLKGNKVPSNGHVENRQRPAGYGNTPPPPPPSARAPSDSNIPPPPAGTPPPPPPGVN